MLRSFLSCSLFFVYVCGALAQSSRPHFERELSLAATDSQKLVLYRQVYDYYSGVASDSAMPYIGQALRTFGRSGYKKGVGAMLLLSSNLYNEKGLLVNAREYGVRALKIYTETGDEQGQAKAHTTIGNANAYLGNYADAVPHFFEALKIFERIGDTSGIVNTYLELGAANDFEGDHDKALGYYKKALELAKGTAENSNVVYLNNNIGLHYARKGNFVEALKYFEIAERIGRNPLYAKARLSPLINMGKVYDVKGDRVRALKFLYTALGLARELQLKERTSRILMEIGRIESAQRPSDTRALEEGLGIAESIDSKPLKADFLELLAQTADKRGDYRGEVMLMKRARVLRDSLFNIRKAKEIANLQSEYELKQTNRQLAALEQSEQRNEMKKNVIVVIAVVLAVTLFTLIIFYTRSRRLNRELLASEGELKKTLKIKDRLLSIIGHDLKGPIGNIPRLVHFYGSEGNSPEDQAYIMKSIDECATASMNILENLLVWAKQQIKGSSYHPSDFRVGELVQEQLKVLSVAAEGKRINIVNNIPVVAGIHADEHHFRFVMRNLVSNAIKFTHKGGNIVIGAEQKVGDTFVTFSVKDDGVGIEADRLQHIFEPYSESTDGTAQETGTSLGLMLCKEFVLQNGGRIWAESEPGKGTVFFFTMKGSLQV